MLKTNRLTATILLLCMLHTVQLNAQKRITVAKDGSGNFTTVQAALDAIPLQNKQPVTIFIKNGIYKEKLHLDSSKDYVTLIGEDRFNTILTYDDHPGKVGSNGDSINTRSSYSFLIKADNFSAENITFQNDAGFTAGQAVAAEVHGDKSSFYACRFVGNQDILFLNSDRSRQYYHDCYIEGTTDFIFGSATAWFDQCHIHSKKNSHVTAASTPKDHAFGFVFYDCVLTGDTSLQNVSLGRPWRPFACVTYIHCYLGPHFMPQGWSNWNTTEYYKTARYSEFNNYGPGADLSKRVSWAKQLSEEEVTQFTLQQVLAGWTPGPCR